jgi:hypothetical protein
LTLQPSYLSMPLVLSPLRQRSHLSPARRLWSVLDPSPHRSPINESTSPQRRPKDSFFVELTGPRPAKILSGRPSKVSRGIGCPLPAVYMTESLVVLDGASPRSKSGGRGRRHGYSDYSVILKYSSATFCDADAPRPAKATAPSDTACNTTCG